MDEDGVIDTGDLPEGLDRHRCNNGLLLYGGQAWPTLRQMEMTLLEKTLSVYPSKSKAAKVLGISRATLYRKMKECGME